MDNVVDVIIFNYFLVLSHLGYIENIEFSGGLLRWLLQVACKDILWATSTTNKNLSLLLV